MYHIKDDQRAKRSAETIYTALVALMDERPFETIKVSDIVEKGDVGRSTFYRNFDLIEDVLRWRCDCAMDAFTDYLMRYAQSQPLDTLMPILKPMLRFFYLDSTIIELLIAAKRIDILQTALQTRFERRVPERAIKLDVPELHLKYGAVIRSYAAVGILTHWVATGKREAPDMLADGLRQSINKTGSKAEGMLF